MANEHLLQETHDAVIRLQVQFDEHLRNEAALLNTIQKHEELLRGSKGDNGLCSRVSQLERWMKSIKALWIMFVSAVLGALGTWFSQR